MKRIQLILACGLTLALTGLTTLLVAAGASRDTYATVKAVHGDVKYKLTAGGDLKTLKVNQVLIPGTIIITGADSIADLSVNELTSVVRVTERTTMALTTMKSVGEGDSSTTLKLDGGTLLGSVKKLSANSDYKVNVPNGVAAIRGTDWQVTVTYSGNNSFSVTFTSAAGTVFCQVNLPPNFPGQNSETLTTGQSWTVSGTMTISPQGQPIYTVTNVGTPGATPPAVLQAINIIIQILNGPPPPPPGPPPGGQPKPPPPVIQPLPPNSNPSTGE
jgi:hypothetical protein